MNIYTLKFNEINLENSYQGHKKINLQLPILKFTYFLIMMVIGSNLIQNIVNQNYSYFIPKIAILIFIIILCFFFKQFQKIPNIILFVVNLVLMVIETEPNTSNNYLDGYLFGSNQMLTHTLLTIGCDFLYGVFVNIFLGIARIVITNLNVDKLAVHQYFHTIIITFGFSALLYQYELYQRRSFLYQAKDTTWEKILPFVICKPFLIFTFDKESFSFQQIAINKSLTESQEMQFNSVGEFLKECKFDNMVNLQQFLFKKYQVLNNLVNKIDCERIEVQYKKSRLKIKLIIYFFDAVRFMIVIEALDKTQIELKLEYQRHIKDIQQQYNNQLKILSKLIKKKLIKSQIKVLSDLTFSVLEYRITQCFGKTKLIRFDIRQQFKKFQTLFSKNKFTKVYFQVQTDMNIQTYRPEFYYFILTLIKCGDPKAVLSFIFDQNRLNQVPELQISGLNCLPQDSQFYYCSHKIFDNYKVDNFNHCWHFKEVLQSYTQVYTLGNVSNDQYNLITPSF